MLLKVLTTTFVIFGLGLLVGLPFVMGHKPSGEDQVELARYGTRVLAYFGVTSLAWVTAAFCAVLLMRRTRKQYADEQKENLKGLIEGTLRDHERK